MRNLSVQWVCWLLLGITFHANTAVAASVPQPVVYHINSNTPEHQAKALRNIQNHIDAVGIEQIKLQVVLHGQGLSLLLLPDAGLRVPQLGSANATVQVQAHVDELRTQGVDFKVCGASLKRYNANSDEDLHEVDAEDIVPNGIAYLAEIQMQGYIYIKP